MPPVTAAGVLAGRVDELLLLERLHADLARGSGNALLIEGEPGIGKTSLVRTATRPHGGWGGWQVFWGTGDELGQELPLLPFLEALQVRGASVNARRIAIAGMLRGEVAADRGADVPAMLAEQLIALVADEADARPAVVVIDDLQWADAASVRLWGRLARTVRQVPLLLIGMTRPVPQREDLLALRRAVEPGHRVQLDALSQPAVAELVGTLAGGRPGTALLRLAGGAGGNPLYLTELLAALDRSGGIEVTPSGTALLAADWVPGSLTGAIADRLGFVSAPARQVLRAAALLGDEFTLTDLAAVLARSVTGLVPVLEEARASGVLADAGGPGLAFRHPLIREALYGELPAAVRRALHRDAARALAAAGAAPDRVARQLLRSADQPGQAGLPATAGDLPVRDEHLPAGLTPSRLGGPADEWMLDWLAESADSLVSQAPGVAAELLAQAVAAMPAGSVRHGWLASRLADALYRTGDHAAAEKTAARALDHAGDPDLMVDLQWTLAQCRLVSGSARESLPALEQALTAPEVTPRHRGRLHVLAARTYLFLGDMAAAGREADRALAAATEAGDTWATGWALGVLALRATVRGELAEGLPLYDRGLAVTETDPALYDLGILLQLNKAIALGNHDQWDAALVTVERARQLAAQIGSAHRLNQARMTFMQAYFELGRWDEALAEIAALPEDLRDPTVVCCELGIAAQIAFHRNDLATARRHLAAAAPYWQRVEDRTNPSLALARSLDREQDGAQREALEILTAVLGSFPDELGETEDLLGDAVRLAVAAGDTGTAQRIAAQAAELAEGSEVPHRQATALYCRGMASQDPAVLLAAAARYADSRRPLPRARALEAAARCLAGAGDRSQARQALEQAAAAYEFLGAAADLSRIAAEFRAHGIRRGPHAKHRRADRGWDSLTDTELRVADLVADGLTNREIAARLRVSPRTVATHVSHILPKLGAAGRVDIARQAATRTTASP